MPSSIDSPLIPGDRSSLRADCSNCFALCCTAFGFQRSTEFPIDKPAGAPCRNLAENFSCTIHDSLRARGFRGCTVFDCFGAGQQVSQVLFGGRSWRDHPETQSVMFQTFGVARQLHEMLWFLAEAATRASSPDTADDVVRLQRDLAFVLGEDPSALLGLSVDTIRSEVRDVLIAVSEETRGSYLAGAADSRGDELGPAADLTGRDLRSRPMCGADLRGAYLIGADLRGADLTAVDLLGADLRDARLHSANLSGALFVTQMQINASQGDEATVLPDALERPQHWLNN